MAGAGYALQGLIDFLIGEHCHACGRSIEGSRWFSPPSNAAAAALAAPVRIGHRRAGIDTHPLCRPCCHELVTMREPVKIGIVHRDGAVSLQSGSRLSAAAELSLPRDVELRVWAAFETDDRLLAVIHALKFSRYQRLAPWFARALTLGLPAAAVGNEPGARVVAVPTDAASLRRRGFNQAERVARAFAANSGANFIPGALAKTRATVPQSSLDGADRARNVTGAFAASVRTRVGGSVVLVDDLVTTGATAAACATALYASGAREVRVACIGYRP